MRRNGMEPHNNIQPAAVYAQLRNEGAVAWLEFGRNWRIVAALRPLSADSRAEYESRLRKLWSGDHMGPEVLRARTNGECDAATLGHAPGAIGWFGYEAGRWFERMPTPKAARHLPDVWWGSVQECAVFDAEDRLVGLSAGLVGRKFPPPPAPMPRRGQAFPSSGREAYEAGVQRILSHLQAGDCYQVNLARHWRIERPGDPLDVWLRLRQSNPARRAALIEAECGAIVSNSPELLLRARERHLLSVPIKGTAPLTQPPESLLSSSKERAELTMIVDLVRSDLGRVAAPGSVRTGPRRVGRVGHVYHAMQRVEATLADGFDAIDALAAVFPPGSVTGAPKVRAMELIHELEPEPRGVYCGAIGWVGKGCLDFNVAIRTITFAGGQARVSAGAGLVMGSNPSREFDETELKARKMIDALC